jgi:hypothetical protein
MVTRGEHAECSLGRFREFYFDHVDPHALGPRVPCLEIARDACQFSAFGEGDVRAGRDRARSWTRVRSTDASFDFDKDHQPGRILAEQIGFAEGHQCVSCQNSAALRMEEPSRFVLTRLSSCVVGVR